MCIKNIKNNTKWSWNNKKRQIKYRGQGQNGSWTRGAAAGEAGAAVNPGAVCHELPQRGKGGYVYVLRGSEQWFRGELW